MKLEDSFAVNSDGVDQWCRMSCSQLVFDMFRACDVVPLIVIESVLVLFASVLTTVGNGGLSPISV